MSTCIPMATWRQHPLGQTQVGNRVTGLEFDVAEDVLGLQHTIVNMYFCGWHGAGDRGWVLVDAGMPFSAPAIRRSAARRFGENARPASIVLTHAHFDHRGALAELVRQWDCPVYAHVLEIPYLTGQASYPPPDPSVEGGMSFMSRFYPRRPIDLGKRVQPLPRDRSVPGMQGWRWVHTPGHTPGHVSFFRDSDRVLIVGDAFVTTRQESALEAMFPREPKVHRPPAYFTPDWQKARDSVALLAELLPSTAATGHGRPVQGEMLRRQLADLVANWETVAIPREGRYARQPAVTGERGELLEVPPPKFDPRMLVALLAGIMALAGASKRR